MPVFFTSYRQVTLAPTTMDGPGAESASSPLVYFSMSMDGPTGLQVSSKNFSG